MKKRLVVQKKWEIPSKKVAEKHGAESELTCEVHLIAYETAKDSVPVKRFERVSKELGLAGNLVETFGGSDNNSFAKNGIPGLVLSNGMYQAHSVNEYTTIKDLVTGAELIAGLITDEQQWMLLYRKDAKSVFFILIEEKQIKHIEIKCF